MLVLEKDLKFYEDYVEIEFKDKYGNIKGFGKIDEEHISLVLNRYVNLMNNGYVSVDYDGKIIGLHRLITGAKKGEIADHINGIRHDNRKDNLRILDNSKNGVNRSKHKNNHSGHRGVFWSDKIPTPKWTAYITINWKRKHLGYFDNFDDAVKARLDAEKLYYDGFAPTDERYNLDLYERTESKYRTKRIV